MREAGSIVPAIMETSPDIQGYGRVVRRRVAVLVLLAVAVAAAFLLDLATGPSSLRAGDVLAGLLAPESLSASLRVIIWDVRLPQALMAVMVGAALSLAGAEMQTILNNPLGRIDIHCIQIMAAMR